MFLFLVGVVVGVVCKDHVVDFFKPVVDKVKSLVAKVKGQ